MPLLLSYNTLSVIKIKSHTFPKSNIYLNEVIKLNKDLRAYTYEVLESDLQLLKMDFPDLEVGTIGKSVLGRNIYYIRIGHGKNIISYNGAHHGMEWITSAMLVGFVREFLNAERDGGALGGFNVPALSKNTSVYIVPMLNPDGVQLSAVGLDIENADVRERLIEMNGSENFSRWQANANGVDLNHNYDALWEKSKAMEKEYGIFSAGSTRFSGSKAESEPESHALAEFTRKFDFKMVLAFHSQGRVIYHGFLDKEPPYSLSIARAFTRVSPYILDETEGIASYGGYKDWFVNEFNRPGYTFEVGLGENPLPVSQLPQIYKDTLPVLLGAMTITLP